MDLPISDEDSLLEWHLKDLAIQEVAEAHAQWVARYYRHEAIRWNNRRIDAAVGAALRVLGSMAEGASELRTENSTQHNLTMEAE